MSRLPKQSDVYRRLWRIDSMLSTAAFETVEAVRRVGSAYSSFLHRFKITGPKRVIVDILDDAATFAAAAALALLAFALPPFSGTGDVWNRGREYAITFTDANGEIIGRRGIRQDDAIPLEDIPPQMVNAVLATEDARFFQHFGIDLQGTMRALIRNASGDGATQGGSSLTQQVAKNLFLTPERTIKRKVHEAFLALWIEARLSKDEILKLYLDRSYLGGGNYGVEAASQYYFGKSVRDVSLAEAAMLAGLFKAPTKYAPHNDFGAARARANVVLYRMLDAGFITQGDVLEARRENIALAEQKIIDSPNWYLDWAYKDTLDLIEEQGLDSDFVIEVKTTIDMELQQAAQRVIESTLAAEGAALDADQAAAVVMKPDGMVKAIVGGSDYEESQFNRATDALRQPGSSFKPFVYLAALLDGLTPDSPVVDGPVSIGKWAPKNYTNKFAGKTTLRRALAQSYNSIPVKLSLRTGRKKIIAAAHDAGIEGEIENVASLPLGTSAVTLLDITTGYATFAAGGKRAKSYTVLEIRRPTGEIIYSRDVNMAEPERIFPEEKIAELNDMMGAVVTAGTGGKAALGFEPVAGKTGTNVGYRDAWFVGFSGNHVAGVWFGNDDFSAMKKVTGGLLPAPVWRKIMVEAERGLPAVAIPGVPLTAAHIQYAADNPPEPAVVAGAKADTPVIQLASLESGEADVQVVDAEAEQDKVVTVLKDMFGLFEDDNAAVPKQKSRRAAPPKAEVVYVKPRAQKRERLALDRPQRQKIERPRTQRRIAQRVRVDKRRRIFRPAPEDDYVRREEPRVTLILPQANTRKRWRRQFGEIFTIKRNTTLDRLRAGKKNENN